METLQREGRALFERSSHGGTLNVSSSYHHVDMVSDVSPYLGFEWEGTFYCFDVLLVLWRPPCPIATVKLGRLGSVPG